jgi:hypothetical protein
MNLCQIGYDMCASIGTIVHKNVGWMGWF